MASRTQQVQRQTARVNELVGELNAALRHRTATRESVEIISDIVLELVQSNRAMVTLMSELVNEQKRTANTLGALRQALSFLSVDADEQAP